VCAVLVSLGLAAPSGASAGFTREFLRQLPGSCPAAGACAPSEAIPFGLGPEGLATDGEDDLWVGDNKVTKVGPIQLSRFGSGEQENPFLQTLEVAGPEPPPVEEHAAPASLAINRLSGSFYLTGGSVGGFEPARLEIFDSTGTFVAAGEFQGAASVTVDNSSEPVRDPSACGTFPLSVSECFVYLAHNGEGAPAGDGQRLGIEKLNAHGAPVVFSASAAYIEGNEIVGAPVPQEGGCEMEAGHFLNGQGTLGAMTVDSVGDIFVLDKSCGEGAKTNPVVLEYAPSGEFVRKIGGAETPGLGGNQEDGGFGGQIAGLAFDPASGHLLLSVNQSNSSGIIVAGGIDEFEAASGAYVSQLTEAAGAPLIEPAQMTVDSKGFLYVSEAHQELVDVWAPGHFPPGVRLGEASEPKQTSVVLNGSVNGQNLALVECRFQWVSQAAFEATGFEDPISVGESPCTPRAGEIPADSLWHPVHALATGLQSGTTYRYRLLAKTAGALGGLGTTAPLGFTAPHAPRIDSTSATNLSSSYVDLRAQIDPLGTPTSYHFEYDTTPYVAGGEAHGTSVPVPDAAIGAGGPDGSTDASVVQQIAGLQPGVTYHFRVVATNQIEGQPQTTDGPDSTFTTVPAPVAGLPDNRAYELLTPPDKGSAVDMFRALISGAGGQGSVVEGEINDNTIGVPSPSGDGFVLEAQSAFAPFSASFVNDYVFARAATAWGFAALASPALGVQNINALRYDKGPLFTPDLSRVAFIDQLGSRASEEGARQSALVGAPGGPYTIMHSDLPVHGAQQQDLEGTLVPGGSRDLSRVFVQSKNHALARGDSAQDEDTRALYESGGEGECTVQSANCRLVNVDSKGRLLNPCGAQLGALAGEPGRAHDAVSADGARVLFTAPDPQSINGGTGCWNGASVNPPQLYMRFAGTTIQISKPKPGVKEEPVSFVGASEDGSKAFFLTETEYEPGINDLELYEYDSTSATLTRVSAGEAGNPKASVFSVKTISPDGATVYFEAFGRLTADAPTSLPEGQIYLYRYGHNGKGEAETSYVATVFTHEATQGGEGTILRGLRQEAPVPSADWYATPDGRYLLFSTSQQLTGYSTANPSCPKPQETQEGANGHCEELYRYDSEQPLSEGQPGVPPNPVCVSCTPSGVPPVSNARFTRSDLRGGAAVVVTAMPDDGSQAFFDTADALVPQDTNGALDVYEWQVPGRDGCAAANGCLRLISSGKDPVASFFLGASPDGKNVFLGTHARLVPQDTDTMGDLYDARVCSAGDSCIKPPAGGTGVCEGDACAPVVPAPPFTPAATQTTTGAGNVTSGTTLPAAAHLTAAQLRAKKLARALRACRTKHNRHKRKSCEAKAHRRYGAIHKATKKSRAGRSSR
jgi:hypothetical protein